MARLDILAPFIFSFEGGWSNDPHDKGGATKYGVTIGTWKAKGRDKNGDGMIDTSDLKAITVEDATAIMRLEYWNRWQGDRIRNQSIANILVDWVWCSGKHGITIPQKVLGVKADGIVGEKTIAALNAADACTLFYLLKAARKSYIKDLCKKNPSQKRFENGWNRRIDAFRYGSLVMNDGKEVKFA